MRIESKQGKLPFEMLFCILGLLLGFWVASGLKKKERGG